MKRAFVAIAAVLEVAAAIGFSIGGLSLVPAGLAVFFLAELL